MKGLPLQGWDCQAIALRGAPLVSVQWCERRDERLTQDGAASVPGETRRRDARYRAEPDAERRAVRCSMARCSDRSAQIVMDRWRVNTPSAERMGRRSIRAGKPRPDGPEASAAPTLKPDQAGRPDLCRSALARGPRCLLRTDGGRSGTLGFSRALGLRELRAPSASGRTAPSHAQMSGDQAPWRAEPRRHAALDDVLRFALRGSHRLVLLSVPVLQCGGLRSNGGRADRECSAGHARHWFMNRVTRGGENSEDLCFWPDRATVVRPVDRGA